MPLPLLPGRAPSQTEVGKTVEIAGTDVSTDPFNYTLISNDQIVAMKLQPLEGGNAASYPMVAVASERTGHLIVVMPAHTPLASGAPSAWWVVAKMR